MGIGSDDPIWADVDNHLCHILNYGYKKYRDHLVNNVLDGNDKILNVLFKVSHDRTGFNIQKYSVGDYFRWHIDDEYMRKLAFIMYLNTLSSDGGETKFWKGKSVRPEQGKSSFFRLLGPMLIVEKQSKRAQNISLRDLWKNLCRLT